MLNRLLLILLLFIACCTNVSAQSGVFIGSSPSVIVSPVTGKSWLLNSSSYTVSVYNGSSFQTVSAPFSNWTATANPTINNDGTQSYVAGSFWLNTITSGLFVCQSNATGAAVWVGVNAVVTTIPLPDLQQGGATNGQSLLWNNGLSQWAPGSPAILLSQLLQSGATTGQVISWNGTAWVASNAGAGTVTTFSAGNLSPLFTTSVSTATTTPALSFALTNAAAKGILSNTSGSSAAPAYHALTLTAGTGLSGGGNIVDSPTVSLQTPVAVANGGTGAGTFAAHQWFGNNTSSTASPGPSAILSTDLPSTTVNTLSNTVSILSVNISGQNLGLSYSGTALPVVNGGTGATSGTPAINNLITGTPSNGQVIEYNGTTWIPATVSGTGTVTSVAMTGDGTVFNSSVSGSPVTAAGTLTPSLNTQSANTVLAGPPTGTAATPTFRNLLAADLPAGLVANTTNLAPLFTSSVSAQTLTFTQSTAASHSIFCVPGGSTAAPTFNVLSIVAGTGLTGGGDLATNPTISLATVTPALGGTGLTATPTNGQVAIGTGSGYALSTLTAGSNISVTNGSGSITINSSFNLTNHNQNNSFSAAGQSQYFIDTSSGVVTCTLPDATTVPGTTIRVFVSVIGHNVTFATVSSQQINGASAGSLTALSALASKYVFTSDGTNWWAY